MHLSDTRLVVTGEVAVAGDGCNGWHIIVDRFSLDSTHSPQCVRPVLIQKKSNELISTRLN